MDISLENLQKKVSLNSSQILKIVKSILRYERIEKASLTIVFVTRQKIRSLNKKFLRRDYATDVLAFDLNDQASLKRKPSPKPKTLVGDIIISTDAALKNAKAYETTLAQELTLYIIHGILHLLGFDDHAPRDIQKMRKKEQELLKRLGAGIKNIVR